jgi:hypothetical protein
MLKRITYVSRYAKPLSAGEIESLGESAAKKNRELGLTGFLMASGGLFYQVIEGPPEVVDEIYGTIAGDERHTDVVLLRSEEPVEKRSFPDWSMRTINLDAKAHVRLLPLKALMKAVDEQRRLVDNMIGVIERTLQYEMLDLHKRG